MSTIEIDPMTDRAQPASKGKPGARQERNPAMKHEEPGAPGRDRPRDAQPSATEQHLPVIQSRSLFGTSKEVVISHAGEMYRLKITRQGKLILNK
jgi:hemin uptake protein HemP